MIYSTKKYSIKLSAETVGKALQMLMLLGMVLYSNIYYDEIALDKYGYKNEILSARGEEFVIRDNYMSMSYNKDEIKNILIAGKPVLVRAVGVNLFNGLVKRRIIYARIKY